MISLVFGSTVGSPITAPISTAKAERTWRALRSSRRELRQRKPLLPGNAAVLVNLPGQWALQQPACVR
ncbi:MAG: hypothetical protein OXF26_12590, partial [Alphaproteobacteria bacterium]|nr:hypothetical protein [Alphaproteobacteria bacterium]